jgi:hypothetical protein
MPQGLPYSGGDMVNGKKHFLSGGVMPNQIKAGSILKREQQFFLFRGWGNLTEFIVLVLEIFAPKIYLAMYTELRSNTFGEEEKPTCCDIYIAVNVGWCCGCNVKLFIMDVEKMMYRALRRNWGEGTRYTRAILGFSSERSQL